MSNENDTDDIRAAHYFLTNLITACKKDIAKADEYARLRDEKRLHLKALINARDQLNGLMPPVPEGEDEDE